MAPTVPSTPTGFTPSGFGHSSMQLYGPESGSIHGKEGWMSMSNSFHLGMSMNGSTASLVAPQEDEDRPEKMELLVGDVKGKVSSRSFTRSLKLWGSSTAFADLTRRNASYRPPSWSMI